MFPSLRKLPPSRLRSERACVLARRGMVCASVPQAAAAGIEMLRGVLVGASDRREDGCALGIYP
ncbi:MAG TPA: hypothetical protein DEP35_18565 [Deltaproteobacteria bacterium]|nr:hypothetical protein [Deltaproteobacteria bacterium]